MNANDRAACWALIRTKITFPCSLCQSEIIVKNGHYPKGKQHFRCTHCDRGGILNPTLPYTGAEKEPIPQRVL